MLTLKRGDGDSECDDSDDSGDWYEDEYVFDIYCEDEEWWL